MRRRLHVKRAKHLWKPQAVKLLNKFRESKGQWDGRGGLTSGLERLGMQGFRVTEKSLDFILSTMERSFNWEVTWQIFVLFFKIWKKSACNAGDQGSLPGWGRSSGEGNGDPLQYSCLENSMDRETWQAPVWLTHVIVSFYTLENQPQRSTPNLRFTLEPALSPGSSAAKAQILV